MFGKKQELQRLNLEAPKVEPSGSPAPPGPQMPNVDPVRLEAANRRAKEILEAGRIPEALVVCTVGNGLLTFRPGASQKPVMLLFSSPFAATDYLRATQTIGGTGLLKVDALPGSARSWIGAGLEAAVLDRCPRCPQFLSIGLAQMVNWTPEDFAKIWAHFRATRLVLGETRIRSAMAHIAAKSHGTARADLEYVRDHFDCSVPYLHQMIGFLAGIGQDEAAKAAAIERLKEFGPQFELPVEFRTEVLATAMVGLMANFGIGPGKVTTQPDAQS